MKNIICILDTECCDLQDRSIYDLGYIICDKKGNIFHEESVIIQDVMTDPEKMRKAYFAKKVYQNYIPMLANGDINYMSWVDAQENLSAILEDYNVNTIAAYNAGFDIGAMRHTNEQYGNKPNIVPHPVKVLDIWQFACETILNSKHYKKFAKESGYITEKGNIMTSAEKAYSYLTADRNFIEEHTALSDCQIEFDILMKCFKQKRKIPYGIVNASPWRIVNEI